MMVDGPQVDHVAVVGAGLMGHGIAEVFALAGFDVRMYSRTKERIQGGIEAIGADLEMLVRNELVEPAAAEKALIRVHGVTDLAEAVREVGFVVEAISEDLKAKQELFGRLETLAPGHTVFSSTTSGMDVNRIAEGTTCPERVIVAHHWNPPHIMTLVEVVPGEKTAPETVQLTCSLLRQCGRRPVVLRRHIPGLIGNRLQFALLREAMAIVESGVASAEEVDTVLETTLGRRLAVTGPIRGADLGGLNVFLSIASYLFKELDASTEPPRMLREAVERGDLGARTGKGIYEWTPESAAEILAARDAELIRWLKATGR